MKTREAFSEFVRQLEPQDLAVAVALREVLRRSGDSGRAEHDLRTASVRDSYGATAALPGGAASLRSTEVGVLADGVDADALRRLEDAGIVAPVNPGEGWPSLAISDDLWSILATEKEAIQAELEKVVQELQRARADTLGETLPVTPFANGSRLRAEGLVKVYQKRKVVNEVGLSVQQGEIVGLLGPNGAGKTTTFYMMVGLIAPNDGDVYLDDLKLTGTPMYRRARLGVGYLAQEPSIFRKLTVEQNVLAILETQKLSRKERMERLDELLAELSISHLRKSKAYSLSGGERRRLEITRALVQRPKFMLLDEPFAGIDPIAVNDIQQIVAGLKHRGIGVIISDHNVEQTLEIVDRAYIMYEGRIRVSGNVSELVWNDEVAEIYLGPTLTQRMRQRFPRPSGDQRV